VSLPDTQETPATGGANVAGGDRANSVLPGAASAGAEPVLPGHLSASLPLRRGPDESWRPTGGGGAGIALLAILLVGVVTWAAWRRSRASPGMRASVSESNGTRGWKRLLSVPSGDDLRVARSARLTPRASVHVVQWNEREWLLSCTDSAVVVLGERDISRDGSARDGSTREEVARAGAST
jgi:hypothetical protein